MGGAAGLIEYAVLTYDDDDELLASTTKCRPNLEGREIDAWAQEESQQQLESCPSTVETDIIVSNLDALTLELKDLSGFGLWHSIHVFL